MVTKGKQLGVLRKNRMVSLGKTSRGPMWVALALLSRAPGASKSAASGSTPAVKKQELLAGTSVLPSPPPSDSAAASCPRKVKCTGPEMSTQGFSSHRYDEGCKDRGPGP